MVELIVRCLFSGQIRSDTNLCLGRTLPTIHKKCLEMEKMFEKIDQLEVETVALCRARTILIIHLAVTIAVN